MNTIILFIFIFGSITIGLTIYHFLQRPAGSIFDPEDTGYSGWALPIALYAGTLTAVFVYALVRSV